MQILTGLPPGFFLNPFLQAKVILSPVLYFRVKFTGFAMYVENGIVGKEHIFTEKK